MKKKINIKKYILLLISSFIFIFTLYLMRRIHNSSFDQYLYSLLKSGGTSPALLTYSFFTDMIGIIILYPILILPTINFKKKLIINIKNKSIQIFPIKKVLKYSRIILAISIVYLAYGVGFFGYAKDMFTSSDLYEKYYVPSDTVKITFPSKKQNLIYIIMESTESSNMSIKNGGLFEDSIMPNLEQLAIDNINFSHNNLIGGGRESYGTGWTVASMIAQTSGVPLKMKITDYKKDSTKFDNITTMGEILSSNGYNNYLIMGSDADFGGRKTYFSNHDYIISDYYTAIEDGKIDSDYHEWWGYEDSKLFEYAKEKLDEVSKNDEPFNLTILTADTHFTDGYIDKSCSEVFDDHYANSFYCSDNMIGEFIEWLKNEDYYDNTTIVITGDHQTMQENFYVTDDNYIRTTYNVFINSKGSTSNIKNRNFNIMDMFPTTIASLGADIEGDRLGLGTNLFSDKKTISEEIGEEKLNNKLKKNSKYYYEYIRGKKVEG